MWWMHSVAYVVVLAAHFHPFDVTACDTVLVTRIKTVPRPLILHFIQVIAPPATKAGVTDASDAATVVVDAVGIIDSATNDDDNGDEDGEVKHDDSYGNSNGGNRDVSRLGPMIVDVDIVDDDDRTIITTTPPRKDRYVVC